MIACISRCISYCCCYLPDENESRGSDSPLQSSEPTTDAPSSVPSPHFLPNEAASIHLVDSESLRDCGIVLNTHLASTPLASEEIATSNQHRRGYQEEDLYDDESDCSLASDERRLSVPPSVAESTTDVEGFPSGLD